MSTTKFDRFLNSFFRANSRELLLFTSNTVITFDFCREDCEVDLQVLKQAILEVDKKFPWKDGSSQPGQPSAIVAEMSDGEVELNVNFIPPRKSVNFQLVFERGWFSHSEFRAYHKAIMRLVEELSILKLVGVEYVKFQIITKTHDHFHCDK